MSPRALTPTRQLESTQSGPLTSDLTEADSPTLESTASTETSSQRPEGPVLPTINLVDYLDYGTPMETARPLFLRPRDQLETVSFSVESPSSNSLFTSNEASSNLTRLEPEPRSTILFSFLMLFWTQLRRLLSLPLLLLLKLVSFQTLGPSWAWSRFLAVLPNHSSHWLRRARRTLIKFLQDFHRRPIFVPPRSALLKDFQLTVHNIYDTPGSVGTRPNKKRIRKLLKSAKWDKVSFVNPTRVHYPLAFQQNLPGLKVEILHDHYFFLLDSGCYHNLVPLTIVQNVEQKGLSLQRFCNNYKLATHTGGSMAILPYGINLPLGITDAKGARRLVTLPFLVEDGGAEAVPIIGFQSVQENQLILDLERSRLSTSVNDFNHSFTSLPHQFHSVVWDSNPANTSPAKDYMHLYIPALAQYTGQVVLSNLDRCCSFSHGPELSCKAAQNPEMREALGHLMVQTFQLPQVKLKSPVCTVTNGRLKILTPPEADWPKEGPLLKATCIPMQDPYVAHHVPTGPHSARNGVPGTGGVGLNALEGCSSISVECDLKLFPSSLKQTFPFKFSIEMPLTSTYDPPFPSHGEITLNDYLLSLRRSSGYLEAPSAQDAILAATQISHHSYDDVGTTINHAGDLEPAQSAASWRKPEHLRPEMSAPSRVFYSGFGVGSSTDYTSSIEVNSRTPPDEEGYVRCGACSLDDGTRATTTSRCRGVELPLSSHYNGLTSPLDLISSYPFQSSCPSHLGDLRDPQQAPEAPMGPASFLSQAPPDPPYPPSGGHVSSSKFNPNSDLCHKSTCVGQVPTTPPKFFSRPGGGAYINHHTDSIDTLTFMSQGNVKLQQPNINFINKPDDLMAQVKITAMTPNGSCLFCAPPCGCHLTVKEPGQQYYHHVLHPNDLTNKELPELFPEVIKYIEDSCPTSIQLGENKHLTEFGQEVLNLCTFAFCQGWSQGSVDVYVNPTKAEPRKIQHVATSVLNQMEPLVRNEELHTEHVGFPASHLEPDGIQCLTPSTNYQQDFDAMLKASDPEMATFLDLAFKKHHQAISKRAADIGCLKSSRYQFDLELKEGTEQLPRQKPYSTSLQFRAASTRIIRIWEEAGIAERSTRRTHGSRLVCVRKHLNQADIEKITSRLNREQGYQFPQEVDAKTLLDVNPDHLTDKEVTKLFRLTLDATELNNKLVDEVCLQQSADSALMDLSIILGQGTEQKFPRNHDFKWDVTDPSLEAQTMSDSQEENDSPSPCPTTGDLPNPLELADPKDVEVKLAQTLEDMEEGEDLFISQIDIAAAHNIQPCTERAKFLLNFVSPSFEFYRFIRAPFGLKKVGSSFNSCVIEILSDLLRLKVAFLYADDLLIICRNKRTHAKLICEILRRFATQGIKLSINKSCFFCPKDIIYLGHKFSPREGTIEMTDQRVNTISNFNRPTSVKGVMSFLGLCVFVRRYYSFLQLDLAPLNHVVLHHNKTGEFLWGQEQEEAFDRVKTKMASGLKLYYVPPNKELVLYTDSSNLGGGAVLYGRSSENPFRPVSFFSRRYTKHESDLYSALELEVLFLLDAIVKCSYYIDSGIKLLVKTDAKALTWLLYSSKRSSNLKLNRIVSKLSMLEVNYEVSYCPPSEEGLRIADIISRQYDDLKSTLGKNPISTLRKVTKDDIEVELEGTYSLKDLSDRVERGEGVKVRCPADSCESQSDGQAHHIFGPLPANTSFRHNVHHNFLVSSQLSHQNIILEQSLDSELKTIVQALTVPEPGKTDPVSHGYYLKDGVLLKMVDKNGEQSVINSRICIPSKLAAHVVAHFHCIFGHMNKQDLIKLIGAQYVCVPNRLPSLVNDIVSRCHFCLLYKASHHRHTAISDIRMAQAPMEILAMDFFSMPQAGGYKSILLVVDHFSQFCFLFPMRSERTAGVVKNLEWLFSLFGVPKCIKSDNGSNLLRAGPVKDLLQVYGVNKVSLSMPYSVLHNTIAERNVKHMRRFFKGEMMTGNRQWPKLAKRVNLARNLTPRVFPGNKFLAPYEIFFNRSYQDGLISPQSLLNRSAYLCKSPEEIESLQKELFLDLKKLKLGYMERHNKKAAKSGARIAPGDLALLKDHRPSTNRRLGKQGSYYRKVLYLCVGQNGTVCMLRNVLNDKTFLVHTSHVKRYLPRDKFFDDLPLEIRERIGSSFLYDMNLSDRNTLLSILAREGFDLQAIDNDAISLPNHPGIPSPKTTKTEQSFQPTPDPVVNKPPSTGSTVLTGSRASTSPPLETNQGPSKDASSAKLSIFSRLKMKLRPRVNKLKKL